MKNTGVIPEFVGDVLLDPANLIGAGEINAGLKMNPNKYLKLFGKPVTKISPETAKNISKAKNLTNVVDGLEAGNKQLYINPNSKSNTELIQNTNIESALYNSHYPELTRKDFIINEKELDDYFKRVHGKLKGDPGMGFDQRIVTYNDGHFDKKLHLEKDNFREQAILGKKNIEKKDQYRPLGDWFYTAPDKEFIMEMRGSASPKLSIEDINYLQTEEQIKAHRKAITDKLLNQYHEREFGTKSIPFTGSDAFKGYLKNRNAFGGPIKPVTQDINSKNFVQRFQNPNIYPVINNKDGSYSTHKMASSDNIVYPTIIQDKNGRLIDTNKVPYDPYRYAVNNNEYLEFENPEQANFVAMNYKNYRPYINQLAKKKLAYGGYINNDLVENNNAGANLGGYMNYNKRPGRRFAFGGNLNDEEMYNNSAATYNGRARELSKNEEASAAAMDIFLGGSLVKDFTGLSPSQFVYGKNNGSTVSKVMDVGHGAAQGIIGGIFPMAKPFIEGQKGIRTAAAGATGGAVNYGGDTLGEGNAMAVNNLSGGIGKGINFDGNKKDNKNPMKLFGYGGSLTEFEGMPHEAGGISLNENTEVEGNETMFAPENYVFSDRILHNKGKTFADRSKAIKRKYKYAESDALAKEAMNRELEMLMEEQESIKQEMQPTQEVPQMAYGGKMKMWSGGITPFMAKSIRNASFGNLPNINTEPVYINQDDGLKMGNNYKIPVNQQLAENPTNIFEAYRVLSSLAKERENNKPITNNIVKEGYYIPKTKLAGNINDYPVPNAPSKIDKTPYDYSQLEDMFGDLSGVGAAVAKGNMKQPFMPISPVRYRGLNYNPAIELAKSEMNDVYATALDNSRNAPTAGMYLGNNSILASRLAKEKGKTVAGIRFQGDAANNEIFNKEAENYYSTNAANTQAKTQYDTAQLLRKNQMIDSIDKALQTKYLDNKKENTQAQILSMLGNGTAKYKADGTLLIKTQKEDGTFEWKSYKDLTK